MSFFRSIKNVFFWILLFLFAIYSTICALSKIRDDMMSSEDLFPSLLLCKICLFDLSNPLRNVCLYKFYSHVFFQRLLLRARDHGFNSKSAVQHKQQVCLSNADLMIELVWQRLLIDLFSLQRLTTQLEYFEHCLLFKKLAYRAMQRVNIQFLKVHFFPVLTQCSLVYKNNAAPSLIMKVFGRSLATEE